MFSSKRPSVKFIDDKAKALALIQELRHNPIVAVDTEFNPDGSIEIWSLSWAKGVRYVILGKLLKMFKPWFHGQLFVPGSKTKRLRPKLVFQNFKADEPVLVQAGISRTKLRRHFHADIMVMDWFHDENDPKHGLKHQSFKWLGWRRKEYFIKSLKQINNSLFWYCPEGKKQGVVLLPHQIMRDLPKDALKKHSRKEWRELFIEYSGDDAESTIMLYYFHRKYLEKIGCWDVYRNDDRLWTLALMRMEARGLMLDLDMVERIHREVRIDHLRHLHVFKSLAGVPQININSNPQMQHLIFKKLKWPTREDFKTAAGNPSLNQRALAWYAEDLGYGIAKHLIKAKSTETLSRTLKALHLGVDDDGYIRTDLNQIAADTGRISSRKRTEEVEETYETAGGEEKTRIKTVKTGMQLQNMPIRREKDPYGMRRAFIAAPGEKMIVVDYSGFELMMAIFWASMFYKNSEMLQAILKYKTPSAIHALSAIRVFNLKCSIEAVKHDYPDQYRDGKIMNFGLLYRGLAAMLCRLFGWNPTDKKMLRKASMRRDAWMEAWPEIETFQEEMVELGRKQGYVERIDGSRVHVAEGLDDDDEQTRWYWERKCCNTPCQGSAAVIAKRAGILIEFDGAPEEKFYFKGRYYSKRKAPLKGASLGELEARQRLWVHDEVILTSPAENADQVLARTSQLMIQAGKGHKYELPFDLAVEGHVADNWYAAKG